MHGEGKNVGLTLLRGKIARKLLLYILIFSSIITLIISSLQVYIDYRSDLSMMNVRLQEIASSYRGGVANAMWDLDDDQLLRTLSGIVTLPDLDFIELRNTDGEIIAQVGAVSHDGHFTHAEEIYQLDLNGVSHHLGTMVSSVSLDDVYHRLQQRVFVILSSQAIKTFFVSFFVLFIVYYLVIVHLERISKFLNEMRPDTKEAGFTLKRGLPLEASHDELDDVVMAVNSLREEFNRHQHDLNKQLAELALFPEQNPNPVFRLSLDGKVLHANPKAEEVMENWHDVKPGYCPSHWLQMIKHVTTWKERDELEYMTQGTVYALSFVPIGEKKYVNVYGSDVSSRHYMEQNLYTAKKEAEAANASKSKFLAAASHDLRQPLQAIQLFNAALESNLQKDGGSDQNINLDILHSVEQSIEALGGLLNSILDISKLEAGIVRKEISSFPIQSLLDSCKETFGPIAEKKGLELRVLPCSQVVISDPVLLKQLLDNLVANAVRYTETGRIVVGCRCSGYNVCIEVWDTGVGIAPSCLDDIFQEFNQLDNPSRQREKGFGLGLAIVKRTAKLLGHDVNVSSVPDKGSRFSIQVPRADNVPTILRCA